MLTHPNMLMVLAMCLISLLCVAWTWKGTQAHQRWLILCLLAAALSQLANFVLFQ